MPPALRPNHVSLLAREGVSSDTELLPTKAYVGGTGSGLHSLSKA